MNQYVSVSVRAFFLPVLAARQRRAVSWHVAQQDPPAEFTVLNDPHLQFITVGSLAAELYGQSVAGTLIFFIMLIPAAFLEYIASRAPLIDPLTVGLKIATGLLIAVNLPLYLIFLARIARRFITGLHRAA